MKEVVSNSEAWSDEILRNKFNFQRLKKKLFKILFHHGVFFCEEAT
jgi:hypothetical protein